MINQVHIQNYKCLRDVTVDLKPLTVLIGPNDSGKTSFLEALQIPFQTFPKGLGSSFTWMCDNSLSVKVKVDAAEGRWGFGITASEAKIFAPKGKIEFGEYRFVPDKLRSDWNAEPAPVLASDGHNLAAVLNAILTGPDRQLVIDLERQLNRAIPTLQGFSTPSVTGSGDRRAIEFTLVSDKRPLVTIPASHASDGAMLLTAFLTLAYTDTANVILVEEPENGLHPGRLEVVIDLLRKMTTGEIGNKPRQVILTTHSPLLLNYVDPSEVRVFRRNENGETTITPMNEVPEIDRLMKTFSPGEIWNLFGEEKMFEGVPV